MSTGTNIERLNSNNEILTTNNTELTSLKTLINNLPQGIDTSDATATSSDILSGKTAYANNEKITGNVDVIEAYKEQQVSSIYSSDNGVIIRNSTTKPICLNPNAGILVDNATTASAIRLTADIIKKGETVLGLTGTLEIGVDTTDSNALSSDLAYGKSAYVKGVRVVGTIPEIEAEDYTTATTIKNENGIQILADKKVILNEGAGITVDTASACTSLDITADKILYGKSILGVSGTATQTSSSQSPVTASDILSGKTAFVNGKAITGNVPTSISTVSSSDNITATSTNITIKPFTRRTFIENTDTGIIVNNSALTAAIALTADMIKKDSVVLGITGTYVGEAGTGTEDATAVASDIISGKTAYVNKAKITGTLPTLIDSTYTSKTGTIEKITSSSSADKYRVNISELATKYTDGIMLKGSNIVLDLTESQLATAIGLDSSMIAEGTTLLGIAGTFAGSGKLTQEEYDEIESIADDILANG